jgi:putative ABC transport system substrate-binding protein
MTLRRRDFITLLGGAAAAWPIATRAQQPALPVIGYLSSGSPNEPNVDRFAAAFRQGLAQVGYVEGRNVAIEFRFTEHRSDRLAPLVTELARRQVNVIFAGGSQEALAAKSATTAVPIVYYGGSDPVAIGLVASLNRPGGNVTGVTAIGHSLGPKRLELIRELLPSVSKVGVLMSPADPSTESEVVSLKAAAPSVGLQTVVFYANGPSDIEAALSTFDRERVGAFIDGGGPLLGGLRDQTVAAALHHRLAMIGSTPESAAGGAVLGYGASITDAARQAAIYVGRILKGERPADLPIMQPTRFDLAINLKTAKALGLDVPPLLLARADQVIE